MILLCAFSLHVLLPRSSRIFVYDWISILVVIWFSSLEKGFLIRRGNYFISVHVKAKLVKQNVAIELQISTFQGSIPKGNFTDDNIKRCGYSTGDVVVRCTKCECIKLHRAHHCRWFFVYCDISYIICSVDGGVQEGQKYRNHNKTNT